MKSDLLRCFRHISPIRYLQLLKMDKEKELKLITGPIGKVMEMPHYQFYPLLIESWNKYATASKENSRLHKENNGKQIFTPEMKKVGLEQRSGKYGLIIYGALTLEGFINFYGEFHDIKGIRDFESSLGTVNKWRIYPQLVLNKHMKKESIDFLKSIFSLRNQLVHKKVKKEEPYATDGKKYFTQQNGGKLLNKVNFILRNIEEIDEKIKLDNLLAKDLDNTKEWPKGVKI